VALAIEIVSTNWRDDYGWKVNDYETLGIQEVWLVDYQGLGGIRYIGSPKQPVISIYSLTGGEYLVNQFRGEELLRSPSFPELNLTAKQIFQGGII
jgi:Uma2 family endonuclease